MTVSAEPSVDSVVTDIRHAECPTVKETKRHITVLRQDEPYYRKYIRRRAQGQILRSIARISLLVVCSILLYVLFGSSRSRCSADDSPTWLAVQLGKLFGIQDRLYY